MAQFLFLVHHADAVPASVDPTRPLSSVGVAQVQRLAEAMKQRGAHPGVVWHSGKFRAKQTAETCLLSLNPFAEIHAVPGLQPDDNPDTIAAALNAETRDVLIASHLPLLPALLYRLTTSQRDGIAAEFPQHACVALEKIGDRWEERWRAAPDE